MPNLVTAAPYKPVISRKSAMLIFGLGATLALAGLVGVTTVALEEQQRDLRQWQRQLQMTAEAKGREVEQWVSAQQAAIKSIAENTSVSLYLGELSKASDAPVATSAEDEAFAMEAENDTLALTTYLHNLLAVESERQGFREANPLQDVKANLPLREGAGMAVFGPHFEPITAAGNFPPLTDLPAEVTDAFRARSKPPFGPFLLNNEPYLFFSAPVLDVQADSGSSPVGYIAGIRKMDASFTRLLKASPQAVETMETVIVAKEGGKIRYVNTLADGTAPFKLALNASSPNLDAAYAYEHPGIFATKRDYRDNSVLFSSHAIEGTNWMLIQKVDEKAAMADSASRLTWFLVSYLLLVGLVTAALIAVWRHASAMRGRANAEYYRQMATRIERQQQLLSLINTSTPNGIAILDPGLNYRYVNRAASTAAGSDEKSMLGKSLHAVLGVEKAADYALFASKALDSHTVEKIVQHFGEGKKARIVQSIFVPLPDIPLPDREENGPGVMIVDRDITDYALTHTKYENTLNQLVDTLVELVDSRDPYAQHHSNGVALIARALGEQLELEPPLRRAAAEAGKLMNVGKIRAPESLLTEKQISSTDKQNISRAMHESARILKNIAFDDPVVETLEQAYEHVDGSGPKGLKEENILPSAQIIALANAFIALISPRAYREAKKIDDALDSLRQSVGKAYSRKAFAALEHFLENGGGRQILKEWQAEQQKSVRRSA